MRPINNDSNACTTHNKNSHHTLYVAYQQTEVAGVQVVGAGPLVPVAGPGEWEESYVPLH